MADAIYYCLSLFISLYFFRLEGGGKNVEFLIRTRLEMENEYIREEEQKYIMRQVQNKITAIDPEISHSKKQITLPKVNVQKDQTKDTPW